jgi:DNA replication protein DnaC
MEDRYINNNNIVISGESSTGKPIGKTLVAAIILKEAIRLRLLNTYYRFQTYDWIDFLSLQHDLSSKTEVDQRYKYSDWLVVDNIFNLDNGGMSPAYKSFIINEINPFFIERQNAKLNTILVFNFDINKYKDSFIDIMGPGLRNIVFNTKTCRISLSGKQ